MNKPLFVLIDDDPVSLVLHRLTILSVFVCEKVEIQTFTSAQAGSLFLRSLKITSAIIPIVLLDLHMPEISGWTFLEQNAATLDQLEAEVFVVSSSIAQCDIERVETFSSTRSFISKPLTKDVLKKELLEQSSYGSSLSPNLLEDLLPEQNK